MRSKPQQLPNAKRHGYKLTAPLALCFSIGFAFSLGASAQSNSANNSLLAQSGGGDAGYLLQAGTSALRANHLDEAMAKFQAAFQISPGLSDAQHQWGIALVKAGRPGEAIEHFKTAISINPQQPASWLSLGGAYQAAGDLPDAINSYSDYINHFPQDRDIAKVKQLVLLLKREPNSNNGATAPQPLAVAASSTASPLPEATSAIDKTRVQRPAATLYDTGASTDDYYKEMLRTGVLRWPARAMPLRIFVDNGNNVTGYRPVFTAILKQAFSDWSGAANGAITITYVGDISKANIICRWSDQPDKFKNSAEAGESRLYSDRYGIAKGELSILTVAAASNSPLSDNRLRAVALHEVGHTLGITGHSSEGKDIMNSVGALSENWRDLSSRDKATILHLYRDN